MTRGRSMNDAPPLAAALERLGSALDLLDAAATRRSAAERSDAARAVELELMRSDRGRLAELLDQALARGRTLEAAHRDVSQRVERSIGLVAEALQRAGEPSGGDAG